MDKTNKFYWFYIIGFFLILALPLLFSPFLFHPAVWGKTIVFRIILSILIFLFIYQILFQKEKVSIILDKIRRKPMALAFWLLIALLGIYFLATLFSSDIRFSLWGSPHRASGFVNFAFYIIFAILAFLILSRKNWQKVWDFSILVGVLVSAVAIFQKLGLFSKVLIPFAGRPPSTISGPIFLALYLLLLSFITLSFAIKEKKRPKKLFYFSAILLFLYVILVTESRAVYFGLFVGSFYFLFLYSVNLVHSKRKRLFLLLKIFAGALLIAGAYGIYHINTYPLSTLPTHLQENKIVQRFSSVRLSIGLAIYDPRYSAWEVSLDAVKAKPILGYGPENFSIGFDKYYDPSLPYINKAWGSWWDRAHNFVFDISVSAGIPALIIYLSLIASLFWGLQKVKKKRPEQTLICHGIQATFLGYLTANFFSFDLFSTYLIFFLLVAYSLYLISLNQTSTDEENQHQLAPNKLQRYKKPIIFVLSIFLIWFIWFYNIKPLRINAKINHVQYSSNNKKCNKGLEEIDNVLSQKSFLDSYLRLKYIEFMKECAAFYPEKNLEYAKKGIELLKYSAEIRPKFTRNWILLGSFTNVLIEREKNPEERKKLIEEAESYFRKAQELSPKHQEIFIEWAKVYLTAEDYQKTKEKSQECLSLNEDIAICYWYLGLSEISLGEDKLAKEHLDLAAKKAYPVGSLISLNQLAVAYSIFENYEELAIVYQKIIELKPNEAELHASLAFVYRELKQYEKAIEEALIFLELKPEAKEEVELFLKTFEIIYFIK